MPASGHEAAHGRDEILEGNGIEVLPLVLSEGEVLAQGDAAGHAGTDVLFRPHAGHEALVHYEPQVGPEHGGGLGAFRPGKGVNHARHGLGHVLGVHSGVDGHALLGAGEEGAQGFPVAALAHHDDFPLAAGHGAHA